jgi:hypothetical protein
VPLAVSKYKGLRFDGLVVYPDREVRIPADAIDATFVNNLAGLIKRVSAEAAPRRVPSLDECRFCDLTSKNCAERVEAESEEMLTTAEF